jgi:hypothetical protein
LATNRKEKAEIWKEHFDKLLNTVDPNELPVIKTGNNEISNVEVEEITIQDVVKAMRNLNNNKAAGTDGIPSELIKYGRYNVLNRIYELVRQIWEEERIPEEWKQ